MIEVGLATTHPGQFSPSTQYFLNASSHNKRQILCFTIEVILLQVLATDDTFKKLCKHPYITAFLDIHFSVPKKVQSQLRDSVAHFAMMILLLEANFILKQGGNDKPESFTSHRYMSVIGIITLLVLMTLETISFIGLRTNLVSNLLQNTLVQEKGNKEMTNLSRLGLIV